MPVLFQHDSRSLHVMYCRYLTDLYGMEMARMKLSQIMGCLVELRELCEISQGEQEKIRL